MVEFCRQHTPDFMIVDLDLSELGLWSSLQAVRGIGTLPNAPLFGLASAANPQLFEKARAAGFLSVFPTHDSSRAVVNALRREIERVNAPAEVADVIGRDPCLNRLRELSREILQTAASLRPRLAEFGEDGPELFGYIENSGVAIRKKLNGIADFSLHDKEIRHDFRNMIGSVTGFAELILMESGLSLESTEGLKRLRHNSREFVEILDTQKAEANA
jgi:CheY-like chemotaxis protein